MRLVLEIETYGVPEDVVSEVGAIPGVTSTAVEERGQVQLLVIKTEQDAEVTQAALAQLGDVQVGRVTRREPTLEDAYVELVSDS